MKTRITCKRAARMKLDRMVLCLAALTACASKPEDPQTVAEEGLAPLQQAAMSTGAQNVNVVNAPSSPVPTVAQGTTIVAGKVEATQSGPWNVGVTGTVGLVASSKVGIDPTNNLVRLT